MAVESGFRPVRVHAASTRRFVDPARGMGTGAGWEGHRLLPARATSRAARTLVAGHGRSIGSATHLAGVLTTPRSYACACGRRTPRRSSRDGQKRPGTIGWRPAGGPLSATDALPGPLVNEGTVGAIELSDGPADRWMPQIVDLHVAFLAEIRATDRSPVPSESRSS